MSDSTKFHIGDKVQDVAKKKSENAKLEDGQVFPCYVAAVDKPGLTVTVKFDVDGIFVYPPVTMPVIGSEYIRIPVRVGDKGIAIAATANIGAVSGLGGKAQAGVKPGNLGALVFVPIGDNRWDSLDGDSVWLYSTKTGARVRVAPELVRVKMGDTELTVSESGVAIIGNVTVTGKIEATGDVKAGSISLQHHRHSNTQPGTGTSGEPV